MTNKILVTGVAGFIGFHVSKRLLNEGYTVIGIDSINDYYDVNLKYARLAQLESPNFRFYKVALEEKTLINNIFEKEKPTIVINLAAQAGVRYSIENPDAYIQSNIVGFMNIIEGCRYHGVEQLIYASSSSVYGANQKMPFSPHESTEHPLSLYAATKKSNEMIAHTYSHLFGLKTTGLRFFTVYGPWGRPDMALFQFADAIINDKPIKVFNNGDMLRDFTFVDDVVESIYRLTQTEPSPNESWDALQPDPATSKAPYRVYNIGNHSPVSLMDYISTLEKMIGKEAEKIFLPMQAGDVQKTHADVDDLIRDTDFKPNTTIEQGIAAFVSWYIKYNEGVLK
ncbi:NAD-dependent epimerase [Listeria booriae]|uniref:NAD-dependent epimerase n=1 Tax=Listeria booriae TaxID=1552123 RepID=A0A7X1CEN9_9LIST|nr:NAD-dependent epimerase [Listeria booriae]MBC1561551.1 NAD-dependent epimerase [Listeria booriae]MBC1574020.1 NAD-dependent epimerase [Listeria booriae]MBC2321744.1 NAD-dependent epimerase [Listeria booriae]MCD2205765.1 NAD-dependent epimerase [Listeria booriae]